MSHASIIHLRCSLSALIAAVLLCGCGPGAAPSKQAREQSAAPSESESSQDSSANSIVIEVREKAARIARLTAELSGARALHTELQQQRAAIDARRVAHEAQGMALLDGMKAQLQEQARQGRDDAAFKAAMQAKLEAALAEDDAFTTSLRDIDARIAETSATIDRLNAERKELQEGV